MNWRSDYPKPLNYETPGSRPATGLIESESFIMLRIMDETLLKEAQLKRLMRHTWDTFENHPPSVAQGGKGVVVRGCVACEKILYPNNQYLSHLALDVRPEIIDKFLKTTHAT